MPFPQFELSQFNITRGQHRLRYKLQYREFIIYLIMCGDVCYVKKNKYNSYIEIKLYSFDIKP